LKLIGVSNKKGFLLLEGLIAFGLLSIVGFAILSVSVLSKQSNSDVFNKLWAQQIVIKSMEELSRTSKFHSSLSFSTKKDLVCYSINKEIIPCRIWKIDHYEHNPQVVYKLIFKVTVEAPMAGLKTVEYSMSYFGEILPSLTMRVIK
jgi:hypothetical protein